jgi:hypothetical protein
MKYMSPNDLGEKFLVEDCQKLNMKEYLRSAKAKLKETLIASEMSILSTPVDLAVSRTGFGGTRYWFVCPGCGHRGAVLFVHPVSNKIGCRSCLNLEYRKRRFKGMLEG